MTARWYRADEVALERGDPVPVGQPIDLGLVIPSSVEPPDLPATVPVIEPVVPA